MPPVQTLKTIAMALGVASGLVEIYIAATAVTEVSRSSDYAGFMIFVIPLAIIAGGLAIRFYPQSYLGAGVILVGIAIQHILIQVKPLYFLPIALAGLAIAIGLYLDGQQRKSETA